MNIRLIGLFWILSKLYLKQYAKIYLKICLFLLILRKILLLNSLLLVYNCLIWLVLIILEILSWFIWFSWLWNAKNVWKTVKIAKKTANICLFLLILSRILILYLLLLVYKYSIWFVLIIFQDTLLVYMVWLAIKFRKCWKNSKNRKKQQKYAYFCLF